MSLNLFDLCFQGTADAVRQYSWLLSDVKNRAIEDVSCQLRDLGPLAEQTLSACTSKTLLCKHHTEKWVVTQNPVQVVILSGDHLYRMDYMK